MNSVSSPPLSSSEQDCLMTEVQIRTPATTTTTTTVKKHKHPASLLKAHLCQNKLTLGLCLSLLLAIAIVISLLFLYILHTRIRQERALCLTPECITLAADTYNAMDTTVDPCEDFYQFACGNWDKSHPIPEGRGTRSSFESFVNDVVDFYRELLRKPVLDIEPDAVRKLKMFYQTCISLDRDSPTVENATYHLLMQHLERFGGFPPLYGERWQSKLPLERLLATLHLEFNIEPLYELKIAADDMNNSQHIILINHPSLFLQASAAYESEEEIDAYMHFMVSVATSLGVERTQARNEMERILQFEKALANIRADQPSNTVMDFYKKISVGELQNMVSSINWTVYFNIVFKEFIPLDEPVVVLYASQYMEDLERLIRRFDTRTMTSYCLWRFIASLVPDLSKTFREAHYELARLTQGAALNGIGSHCLLNRADETFAQAMTYLYLKSQTDDNIREELQEVILNIRSTFYETIKRNTWMTNDTKKVALAKAQLMSEFIAYPLEALNETYLNLSHAHLNISFDNHLNNVINLLGNEVRKNIALFRKPVDKKQWMTSSAQVNALYDSNRNAIIIPVGMTRPFLYSSKFPHFVIYGRIGMVIAHEIIHGFDTNGRYFDEHGNLFQWWNNETDATYRETERCIVEQYSNYTYEQVNMTLNGNTTRSENIADIAGTELAFLAYKQWLKVHGTEHRLPLLDKYTHEQMFFIAFSQIWCGNYLNERLRKDIRDMIHTPFRYRMIGSLHSSYHFSRAFQCNSNAKMNPQTKCTVF
ncbi:unnamed protein product [Adineta steineri]|uniref:Uncharacterized protein n=5 Tax=Adineta steineri TaxID=433720 RepID=A0A814ACU3_9BILA|nr:unnamed protein product [Adineta steineri]CAF1354087.1 unnamed protein product [Adineta steineri]CAF3945643.1 unnamed protein product [Adineta steineri]